jgi:competence ComEA-like helix-hairpin-helix protein
VARPSSLYLLRISFGLQFARSQEEAPRRPVNLNTANSTQLQEVPEIGPATADKVRKMRRSYGPFKSVDDLRAIKGIGPKRVEKMRKCLTVAKPVPKKDAGGAACQSCAKAEQKPEWLAATLVTRPTSALFLSSANS